MIKLLIADDEMLEREGLAYMVQTLMPNRFECVLAENGKKAVELAERIRPDVVFLDIKMPGMNGLDAAELIKEAAPLSKLLFISAYDHFDYARDAIRLGAQDYLLKPIKRDKLLEVLDRIVNAVTQDRSRRQNELAVKEKLGRMFQLAESDCTLHLMQGLEPSEEVLEIVEVTPDMECTCLVLQFAEGMPELSSEWIQTMHDHFSDFSPWLLSPIVGASINAFVFGKRSRAELLQAAQSWSRYLEQQTTAHTTTGIGNTYTTPSGWARSYQEAYQASRVRVEAKWRFFDSLTTKIEPMVKIEKQLVDYVLQGNTAKAEELAWEYGKSLDPSKRLSVLSSDIWVVLEWEAADMGIPLTRPDGAALSTLESFVTSIRFAAEICREFHGSSSFSMQRAKEYMEQHYREELTLEKMAEFAQISPYYFSKQFKATFGQSFVEYVTELRMREASRLILEGHYFKEVCYTVGYNNPTYFSRVFKKHFGMSPTEWKAQ